MAKVITLVIIIVGTTLSSRHIPQLIRNSTDVITSHPSVLRVRRDCQELCSR
eukprot:COSAG02_NODE_6433_length_3571_cov_2.170507_4_plen_52_part_00